MRGRFFSRSLILIGLLAFFVALAAPVAYGDGIVDGADAPVTVDTEAVTEVTEAAPAVSEASPVEDATAAADQGATSVGAAVDTSSVAEPVEATTVETGTVSTSVSTATTSEVPVSADPSGGGDAGAVPTSSGTEAPSGTTSAATGSTTSGPGYSKSSMTIASSSVTSMPPAQRAALRGPSGPFVSGAGRSPQDLLDDLLGIGDSLGVDDVRGVQITSARGEAGDAPASSGASVPAPLALTGIAIGAFVAVGSVLLFAGNGARSAGSASTA